MKNFASLLTVTLLLLSSCDTQQKKTETPLPSVRLATVQVSAGSQKNSYPGRTQAAETSNAAFRVSGTLASVPVKVGQHVRKGQVLARMDSRDYEVQLKAITAEYESTKAECERVIALYEDNGTSQNNYDKARYGLEQITMKYQYAKNQLEDCVLQAPFDGYVQAVLHQSHETIGEGMPVVSLFASNGTEVVIYIPAVEYMRREEFSRFRASFAAMPGKVYNLRLLTISQKANANQLFEMHLLLEDDDNQITPGMTAIVDILYKENDLAPVEIPSSAVFEDNGQNCVYLYDVGSGTIHKTAVRISSLERNGYIRVVKGLDAGQKVVSAGVHHLSDGMQVVPVSKTSKTNVGGLL